MEPLTHARFIVHWHKREPETIVVQYNPTEFTLDKSAQIAEVAIPGLDSPLLQFIRGQTERLTLDLFFDTTDCGTGAGATSVTTWTDKIYQLVKIEPSRHAPPVCTFVWNDKFPGSAVGSPAGAAPCATEGAAAAGGAAAGAAGAAGAGAVAEAIGGAAAVVGASLGNQRRNGFQCIVESVRQKFTLFSHEGVPLRATLTVVLREYRTLEEQLQRLNLSSPDRTHSHVLQQGETLSRLAAQYYDRPGEWRAIADENAIEDPRRLAAGIMLAIPPIR